MDTSVLKKFAQAARRSLMEQVAAKLAVVLLHDSPARREHPGAVAKLEEAIGQRDQDQVAERVAYIWFNRFCALRFMDVNNYSPVGVVSPAPDQTQPEILAEAKMGHIDEDLVPDAATRERIFALLRGSVTSHDPQAEAYRLLLVAVCNFWHKSMPFMFERIHDYAELLMPDDLLSESSILAQTREAMTEENCTDVEVIGWLYQFYISEKKDAVFEGLKKNKKVTPENIPAATQLFTPHWIVRYLVENALGRLWLLNRPKSNLAARMEYYIQPEEAESDFLQVNSPEEIKICDPACGSGHMLTYAFDLLYAIYEEEGYAPAEIPSKILTHNLYGVEIDERAGNLAAFALSMKARAKQRGFFRKPVQPRICVLQNIKFMDDELARYMDFIGRDLFTTPLVTALHQFEEADNFGSLIRPEITDAAGMRKVLAAKNAGGNMLLYETHQKVLRVLEQSEYLIPRYHVVIANPPYMGGKGMNNRLGAWAKHNYPNSKADLFAMFMERNLELVKSHGMVAMITMQSWMFLSSFESLRTQLTGQNTILSMAHLGTRAFDSIGGEIVSTTAFVLERVRQPKFKGDYLRLVDGKSEGEKNENLLEAIRNPQCGWFFRASAADFKKIPDSPIAYWASERIRNLFVNCNKIGDSLVVTGGMTTADNDRFLRLWHEISNYNSYRTANDRIEAQQSKKIWFPYNKGGEYRKWFGNREHHVNWFNDGQEITSTGRAFPRSKNFYFKESLTYSATSSANFGIRYSDGGFLFDAKGSSCFADKKILYNGLGVLASKLSSYLLKCINPTIEFQTGNIAILPFKEDGRIISIVSELIDISRQDWDAYEVSWDFTTLPFLSFNYRQPTLAATYTALRTHWHEMTRKMQRLEEENNRIFIEAYGLQDELTPDVPLKEITLTCNPHYRYGGDKTDEELEALLLADTMKEFISYAVGCMFGRYALEKPGLVLANQGETIEDYFRILGEELDARVRPESVSLKGGALANCFRCGKEMRVDDARFILQRYSPDNIAGRPMIYCTDCCKECKNTISMNIPLPEFSYACAVAQQWTARSTLNIFIDMAKCFEFEGDGVNKGISFPADDDNVIPMLDGDWFTDDVTGRFRDFLRLTFGEEHYEDNLAFIEKAIGKDIRKYLVKDFYNDHLKRYKKRPIYWLFSSPKGSFNALVYMHRYRPDTVSVVLNDYLREFLAKLATEKNHLEHLATAAGVSPAEKNRAIKELDKIRKMIKELEDYERDTLYPLATRQIAIDLDDGVKVNYCKFGAALKKIPGLDAKEE